MTEYTYKDYYLSLFRLTLHGAVDPVRRYMAHSAYVFYNAAVPIRRCMAYIALMCSILR